MSDTPFDDIERLFEQFSEFSDPGGGTAAVPVDVLDRGDRFVLRADLPGYESLSVTVSDGRTVGIEAERSEDGDDDEDGDRYVRRERPRGTASRDVPLPEPVRETEATASYDDGVLTVELPKEDADGDGTEIPVE